MKKSTIVKFLTTCVLAISLFSSAAFAENQATLFADALYGSKQDLEEFLKSNADKSIDLNSPLKDIEGGKKIFEGFTPLNIALENTNIPIETISLLLEKGADVNGKNLANTRFRKGWTPLISAVFRRGDINIVTLLVQKGARVNENSSDGYTVLMGAAGRGSKEMYDYLRSLGAEENAEQNDDGANLAWYAACGGNEELLLRAIDIGSDVNVRNTIIGRTPLMANAAFKKNRNPRIAAALIAAGADVHAKDNNGKSAEDLAEGDSAFIDQLHKSEKEYLERQKEAESTATVQTLKPYIASLSDINARASDDTTLLFRMLKRNADPDVIALLLRKGASPKISISENLEGYFRTRIRDVLSVVKNFASKQDNSFYRSLCSSIEEAERAVNRFFADGGSEAVKMASLLFSEDLEKISYGITPLHYAARYSTYPSVISMLIKFGANPAAGTLNGETPLHWAARYNSSPAVIQELASHSKETLRAYAGNSKNVFTFLSKNTAMSKKDKDFIEEELWNLMMK